MGADLYMNPPEDPPLWKQVKNLQMRKKSLTTEKRVLQGVIRKIEKAAIAEGVDPGQRLFEIEEIIRKCEV